jgi:hypothetical protein
MRILVVILMGLLVLRIVAIPISAETNVSQIEEINANMKITSDTLQALVTAGMLSDNSFAIFSPLPVEPNQVVTIDPRSYGIHPEPETLSSKCARIGKEYNNSFGEYYATINGVDYCKIILDSGGYGESGTYFWIMWPADGSSPKTLNKSINGSINIVAPTFSGECVIKIDDIYYSDCSPGERMIVSAPEGYHRITFERKKDGSYITGDAVLFKFAQSKNYDFSNALSEPWIT